MPQIPSSVFSLLSVSHGFGGLFFGAKLVLVNLFRPSNPPVPVVLEYSGPTPTRTIEIHFPPTRCIPGPSSGSSKVPYAVFLLGFAAIIIASLLCILCIKSEPQHCPRPSFHHCPRSSFHHCPRPSPSPQNPRLTSRRNPWLRVLWLYLAIIVLGIPAAHHIYYDNAAPDLQDLIAFNKALLDGWHTAVSPFLAISHQIVLHWSQYRKIGLLALTSHSLGILIFFAYRRWYRPVVAVVQFGCFPVFCTVIVPFTILGFTSKLNWILWFACLYCRNDLPSVHALHHGILQLPVDVLSLVGATESIDIWMLLGPLSLTVVTLSLLTISLSIRAIPWAFRTMYQRRGIIYDVLLWQIWTVPAETIIMGLWLSFCCWHTEYHSWAPEVRRLYWQSYSHPGVKAQIQQMYESIWERNLSWKMERIEEWRKHGGELRIELWEAVGVCMETWAALHVYQKSFIIVPVAMLYGHFYVMPAARKLRNWYVNCRFRLRDGGVWVIFYGHFYVMPASRKLRNWYVNWRFRLRPARGG